jgi:hypothetical protein
MKNEIRWLGPYKPTDRFADNVTVSELVRLRKENQELQDYLENLESYIVMLEAGIIDIEMAESLGRKIHVSLGNKS